MAYTLHAVIASIATLSTQVQEIPGSRRVDLNQDLGLIPLLENLFDHINDGYAHGALGFWRLPPGHDLVLRSWAVAAPVAYVEAEYFGCGTQRAVVWQPDGTIFGPVFTDEGEPTPDDGSPISQALRVLGAHRGKYRDEFEAVGLNRHRMTEEWIG